MNPLAETGPDLGRTQQQSRRSLSRSHFPLPSAPTTTATAAPFRPSKHLPPAGSISKPQPQSRGDNWSLFAPSKLSARRRPQLSLRLRPATKSQLKSQPQSQVAASRGDFVNLANQSNSEPADDSKPPPGPNGIPGMRPGPLCPARAGGSIRWRSIRLSSGPRGRPTRPAPGRLLLRIHLSPPRGPSAYHLARRPVSLLACLPICRQTDAVDDGPVKRLRGTA